MPLESGGTWSGIMKNGDFGDGGLQQVKCYTTSIYSNSARIAFVWIKYKVSVCNTSLVFCEDIMLNHMHMDLNHEGLENGQRAYFSALAQRLAVPRGLDELHLRVGCMNRTCFISSNRNK